MIDGETEAKRDKGHTEKQAMSPKWSSGPLATTSVLFICSLSPICSGPALGSIHENILSLQGRNSAFWLFSASCEQLDTLTLMDPDSTL